MNLTQLLPVFSVPGLATRWVRFCTWLQDNPDVSQLPLASIVHRFSNELGRITSYRALALDPVGYQRIVDADSIWPSCRLRVDEATASDVIRREGVAKVMVSRLYIGQRLVPLDPSLSLHDDWETAVCIAQAYARPHGDASRVVHLFELDVPLIETVAWRVLDVQKMASLFLKGFGDGSNRWFEHNGIWFDAYDERTERYVLNEIPFLNRRLRQLRRFANQDEITAALLPFKAKQQALHG
jgi:hypothetical protein